MACPWCSQRLAAAGGGSDPQSGSSAHGSASSLRRQLRDAGALRMANCRCAGPKRNRRIGMPISALGRTVSCSTRARTARHASPAAARHTTSRWTCTRPHRQPPAEVPLPAPLRPPPPFSSTLPPSCSLLSDPGSLRCTPNKIAPLRAVLVNTAITPSSHPLYFKPPSFPAAHRHCERSGSVFVLGIRIRYRCRVKSESTVGSELLCQHFKVPE